MSKIKLVALLGKSGSGKDTILKTLPEDWNRVVPHTSRPKRENEIHGKDYYFVSRDEMIDNPNILGKQLLNWYYGFHKDSFDPDAINVGVFNPGSLKLLEKENIFDILVFNIFARDKTRILRSLNREKNPNVKEIVRRFGTDEKDFCNLDSEFPCAIWLENETEEDLSECSRIIEVQGRIFFD